MANQNIMAKIPKVDQILANIALAKPLKNLPRSLILKIVRSILEELRSDLLSGKISQNSKILQANAIAEVAHIKLQKILKPSLRRVINATGVILHTNLGRSILANAALKRLIEINNSYSNLEYDLDKGNRGDRQTHLTNIIKEITGAQEAIVVNNNAAAVYLCLQSLADKQEVIISRGQLVEIGNFFRIPDLITKSGAVLREVGTTNKTYPHDYEQAITSKTGLLLKIHTSNFALVGFYKEVSLKELRLLANHYHLTLMEDLGSGNFIDLSLFGLPKEPTVQESITTGADLVTFSGDKLLGGPQAGFIIGKAKFINLIRTNPLIRAFRIDKLSLAALEATLEIYRNPRKAINEIPTLQMLTMPYKKLKQRASLLANRLRALKISSLKISTLEGESRIGGGALPLATLPTRLLQLNIEGISPSRLEQLLRNSTIPIIARLDNNRLLIDVRTLISDDYIQLVKNIAELLPK